MRGCRSARRWSQQYRGSAVDIVYSPESLREIFVNNVRLVKSDRMVQPERVRAQPARGVPRPHQRHRHLHARGGGRVRVHLPPHAAAAARPDDDRRAADRAAPRRTAQRVPPEGGGPPGRDRDRARVPGRDRAVCSAASSLERLFDRLPGHVLTPRRARGDRRRASAGAASGRDAFSCAVPRRPARLRAARPRARRMAPAVPAPGRSRRSRPTASLPRATHYLIHPVLFDVIARINPRSCSASTASTSSATTGRGASRERSSGRSTCASAAC